MKFRGLDAAGDWQFGQGVGSYAQEQDALALDIRTRILSWYGNCFFEPTAGVNWKDRLGKGQQAALVSELSDILQQTDGVVKINFVTAVLDPRSRRVRIQYNVDTIYTKSFQNMLDTLIGV